MISEQKMVEDFHVKYGAVTANKPTMLDAASMIRRMSLITSEAAEFSDACRAGDFTEMVDALVDLLYVTYGAAVEMGVDLEPCFVEVHRSNMTKDGGGKDSGGKVLKGPNFSPPNLEAIIDAQRCQQ